MVRQKAPVAKPSEYQRIQPRRPAATANKAISFDAILRQSNAEVDKTEPNRLDDQVDHLETAAVTDSMLNEHDDAFDYEDPFELELNTVESSKDFAADPEDLAPSVAGAHGDYVEQISDRVATKLADMLLPVSMKLKLFSISNKLRSPRSFCLQSLDEIRSNIAKLVEMLSSPGNLPSLKLSHAQRLVSKAKTDSHYSHANFAKIKAAPLLSVSPKFQPDDQAKSSANASTDQSSTSSAATSADEAPTYPSIDKNLSYLKINSIYHKSHSIQNFATNLLLHLFDISELTQNVNVNGRVMNGKTAKNALDEKRINIIRQIVEEKAEYDEQVWPSCVNAMNKKISAIKKHKRK